MALVLVLLVILVLNSMVLRSCLGTAAWWVVFLSLFAAMWYGDFSWTVRIVLGALMVGLFLWRERRED